MNEYFTSKLIEGFKSNDMGGLITNSSAQKLEQFANLLIETNNKYNLTAITDDDGIILKHFIDSASISLHIPHSSKLIDVGCGAGFPSLPLAIIREDLYVKAIDSTGKKVNFVNFAAKQLGLTNISAECTRAEVFANVSRETFDVCTSRAVARLNILSELCIPLIKTGGVFIAMKSSKGGEEIAEAGKGIETLGCSLNVSEVKTLKLNESTIEREIYVFKKLRQTPKEFPRNYSQICKKPL